MSYADTIRRRSVQLTAGLVLICALMLFLGAAMAAGPSDIVVYPADGQSAEQQRRDRYECHNWAVEQTGSVPAQNFDDSDSARERRAERIGKVLTGAAVGAAAGSIIRGSRDRRDADEGAVAGGVLGAIAGAVIGDRQKDDGEDEVFDEYFRALDACMSARGYSLAVGE